MSFSLEDRLVAAQQRGAGGGLWPAILLLLAAVMAIVFLDGLLHVFQQWQREEYSYGYIVPPITALLVWARLQTAPAGSHRGAWLGVLLIALAVVIAILARVGGMPSAVYYAFLIALFGLFLAALGWRPTWHVAPALAYLLFALPLPQTLYLKLSTALQTISTRWSVDLMRSFGVVVYRDGNVIDLGTYQLQVAEACSGLGYLFPLASFAYLLAYLYAGGWIGRIVILLATIPITVGINVLRIAVTGVLVDNVGPEAADGFIHAFEGYVIFFVGVALFVVLIWIMGRLRGHRGSLLKLFRFELVWHTAEASPDAASGTAAERWRPRVSRPLIAAGSVLAVAAVVSLALPKLPLVTPPRASLASFPLVIDDWRGSEGRIAQNFLDILRLDDYLLADFRQTGVAPEVNLYVAYYEAQNERASIHSPEVCIPAGGWEITDLRKRTVTDVGTPSGELAVNRLVIAKGLEQQLVYYWFELRGRQMTEEYTIKLANLWDGITQRRTDGALVRVMTPVARGEDPDVADRRLQGFVRSMYPQLTSHVPD